MHENASVRGRRIGGFSLIELLTVLVIVAVMASIAAPSMGGYVDRTRTRRGLDHVAGDLAYARILAVQQGRRTALRVQSGGTYTVDTLSVTGNWGTVRTVRLGDSYPGVTFVDGATVLEFGSRGLLANLSADGFVKLSREGIRDSLLVSTAGRVYREF